MNTDSNVSSPCPEAPFLVCVAARGRLDAALAVHMETCTSCRELLPAIREHAAHLPQKDRLTDCDEAEVILGEIDEGMRDPVALAALALHMRECAMCYERVAPLEDSAPPRETAGEDSPAEPFTLQGNGRFEIKRRLGAGGMGVVYEAYDRKHNVTVALKTLRDLSPQALYRLKNEFRERQDLQHPNLVNLGELIEHQGQWFFTMELVRGVDFLHHVRPSHDGAVAIDVTAQWQTDPTVDLPSVSASHRFSLADEPPTPVQALPPLNTGAGFDEARLRSALGQLCLALRALHEAGKVHRDVKPGNTMVTDDGRLLLLDFGLITDVEPESAYRDAAGTPAYMAPEQAEGKHVGPAADLYSLGVLLYQALTGRLPFPGNQLELFLGRGLRTPPRPRELVPEVPPDLDELCMNLIAVDPEARPTIAEVLGRIQGGSAPPLVWESITQTGAGARELHVGRDRELSLLQEIFVETRAAEGATVLIHGEPGVGKSALVQRFRAWLRESGSGAVILAGRCYERESVPYKAFDKVIDTLGRFLSQKPPHELLRLMPPWAWILGRVFPVLARVVASDALSDDEELAPRELRARMFAALRQLLANIAAQVPLVISIDDLHWADADSLALLQDIMRPPGAPRLLLLATLRDSSEEPVSRLAERIPGHVHTLALGRLEHDAAIKLADLLLAQYDIEFPPSAATLAREAGDHPLFIHELVRGAALGETTGARFEKALWSRIQALEAPTRRLLEAAVVASAPMPQAILGRAAGIDPSTLGRAIDDLRATNLVRAAARPGWIEPYHERVSSVIMHSLDAQAERSCHERLAWAMEAAGVENQGERPDPELLAVHWRGAGDTARASRYAIKAGNQALKALAFEQAVRLHRMALELVPPSSPQRQSILANLGEALASADRGLEAAEAFAQAAGATSGASALRYRFQAAESQLAAGRIEAGLTGLGELLGEMGMGPGRANKRTRLSLAARARSLFRGAGARSRAAGDIPADELATLDIGRSACLVLGMADPARAADALASHLLMALDVGEPVRSARALAWNAAVRALRGKSPRRVAASLDQAETLAERADSIEARATILAVRSLWALCRAAWQEAHDLAGRVDTMLRERKAGMIFELGLAHICLVRSLFHAGRLAELGRLVPRLSREASEHGGRAWHIDMYLKSGFSNLIWLAADDVHTAARARAEAAERWPVTSHLLIHHIEDLIARLHIHLYTCDSRAAWHDMETSWPALERSGFLDYPLVRVECVAARARSALAAAARGESSLVRACARDASSLAGEKLPHAMPMVELLRAGMELTSGRDKRARDHLRRAIRGFRDLDMSLHEAVARLCLGTSMGGDKGNALSTRARRWMSQQGIVAPARIAAVLAPGCLPD